MAILRHLRGGTALILACSAPEPVTRPELACLLAGNTATFQPEGSTFSAALYSLGRDTLLFGLNETLALIPASGQKLLTTACAIEDWDEPLARALERGLRRSKSKSHKALLDPAQAESLGQAFRPESSGLYLLNWVNHHSDNFIADRLLGLLCRRKGKRRDRFIEDWLDRHDIERPGLVVADGSGISNRNRVAAVTIAGVLRMMGRSEAGGRYRQTLPRPGSNSTLARKGLGLGSRVSAKTGYIRNVFSLCGYVSCPTDTYAFTFILNGNNSGRASYRLFTRLLLTLYHWDRTEHTAD